MGMASGAGALRAGKKGQSAIEFLTTYGWAVLVALVIIVFVVRQPSYEVPESCLFSSSQISCRAFGLNTTGSFVLDLRQDTGHPINVTMVKCTQDANPDLSAAENLTIPVTIGSGGHAVVANASQSCYRYSSGKPEWLAEDRAGQSYAGKVFVRYVELDTGYEHTAVADVNMKFQGIVIRPPS